MALITLMPESLKHSFPDAQVFVITHVPTMNEYNTLVGFIPWLLKRMSIGIGDVTDGTGKSCGSRIGSNNIIGLRFHALVHLLDVLNIEPHTRARSDSLTVANDLEI